MSHTRTRLALAAGITTILLTLGACGGDDNSDDQAAPSDTPDAAEALEQAVRDYIAANTTGDADTGWGFVSARCQQLWGRAEFEQRVQTATDLVGPQDVDSIHVDQLAGDLARVTYTVGAPELNRQQQPWVREGGTWRYDDC
ncbi:hypothetical protein [Streptomyces hoynatensis]|uniref:Nuclear transport factor 2 family protein n=1 Tax=Streptomyces hoynatensis TaxID=1141874 RepID=A0A3A9Z039_9ACTN|nr:hypothetical protein [Streptomyces hoynatensis]RKN40796.1 hypothetical protein D7294_17050 [Streptomyces hoynatensis]